jgi:Tfp pilus assembly protein PilF
LPWKSRLDAISPATEPKPKSTKLGPTVYAMPALTPSVDLFSDKARLLLAAGHISLFANAAEFGGSRAFARAERLNRWYAAADGTQPLAKHSEALVILEADPALQFEVRKSTGEHFPVQDVKVLPFLYPDASQEANDYSDIMRELKASGPSSQSGLRERIERFALMDERVFPGLMQEKIKHFFRNVVDMGLAKEDDWIRWLEPVIVKATTSPDKLRWELCGEATELIHELLLSDKYAAKSDQLSDVHRILIGKRRELGKRVAASVPAKAPVTSHDTAGLPGAAATPFEPPFYDRQPIFSVFRKFVESSASSCLVLAGMRGIGKTSAVREVFKKFLPPTWRRVWIQLTEGIGYPRLIADIAHKCGIRASAEHIPANAEQGSMSQDVLLYLAGTPRVALVLDDLQHALDPAGDFVEQPLAELIHGAITRGAQSRNKIVLITTHVPKFKPELQSSIEVKFLTGLEREDAETLLSFWYHFEREDLRGQPVNFPDALFSVLSGHPLGLRVAAKMWAESPLEDAELSLFKRLREAVVAYILDRVNLTPREEEFIRFASVFRLPVGRGVFLKWRKDEANFMMDSFAGRSLLEADADKYQLHPLIREHFYNSTSTQVLQPYHRMDGQFFLDLYNKAKAAGANPDPEDLGEAIYHFVAAGEREKARSFALYRYEIRPVALTQYRKREFDFALKNYLLLSQLDPNDVDAHFHLCLIYARKKQWDFAETHFGKAMALNPRAYWILQGYGHQRLNNDQVELARHLLLQAERIKPDHSATLVDLGRIYVKDGFEPQAEDYFERAIEADENNPFAYITYARFLMNQQRYEEGLSYALAAVEVNPRDHASRELVNELRRRIERAKAATVAVTKPA